MDGEGNFKKRENWQDQELPDVTGGEVYLICSQKV